MRVLVTGISGFVGRHFAASLIAAGHETWGLDLNIEAAPEGVYSLEWDLTRSKGLSKVLDQIRPDALVHLAGQASPAAASADPDAAHQANVTATLNLLEAMRLACPDRLMLFISSAEVYGPSEHPHREDEAPAPMNPYGRTKAEAEVHALGAQGKGGPPVIVSRSFPHSGPGQRPDFVLPAFARQVARMEAGLQEPVLRVGNLDPRRDWLHVKDVCRAYLSLLERGQSGEIYNVCSGKDHSVREALDYLVNLARVKPDIEIDPERVRPVDTPRLAGTAAKLRTATEWKPSIDFETLLAELLNYWRDRVNEEELR
ncbi:GDP-mannose 4,6-dehydratase [bacterium]|nr:GDP-mannose 4,6-dehydratase [bacterium]